MSRASVPPVTIIPRLTNCAALSTRITPPCNPHSRASTAISRSSRFTTSSLRWAANRAVAAVATRGSDGGLSSAASTASFARCTAVLYSRRAVSSNAVYRAIAGSATLHAYALDACAIFAITSPGARPPPYISCSTVFRSAIPPALSQTTSAYVQSSWTARLESPEAGTNFVTRTPEVTASTASLNEWIAPPPVTRNVFVAIPRRNSQA